jgi:hypothetical protein
VLLSVYFDLPYSLQRSGSEKISVFRSPMYSEEQVEKAGLRDTIAEIFRSKFMAQFVALKS